MLECLPGLGAGSESTVVNNIITMRDSDPPIRNVGQLLTQAGINPQAIGQMSQYLDVRGNTYEVHATATIGRSPTNTPPSSFATVPTCRSSAFIAQNEPPGKDSGSGVDWWIGGIQRFG